MVQVYNTPIDRQFKNDGSVAPGWKLYFYDTGTTTPRNVYAESSLTTPLANPVPADSDGRFAQIFLDTTGNDYKVILTDADDVTIWSSDPVSTDQENDPNSFDSRPMQHWGTTGGGTTAYTITPTNSISDYNNKLIFSVQINTTNTGASTLAVSELNNPGSFLTAKNWKKYNNVGGKVVLEANDILTGQRYIITYDGTDFICLNPGIPYLNLLNCTQATTALQGIIELITNAEILVGTDSSRAITTSALKSLIGGTSRAGDGYAKLLVGIGTGFGELIIQWGTENVNAGSTKTFTLPYSFSTVGLNHGSSYNDNATGGGAPCGSYNLTTTQLSLSNAQGSAKNINWYAIGY